jgi:hypothetical protein
MIVFYPVISTTLNCVGSSTKTPGSPADHRLVVGLHEPTTGRHAVTSTGVDHIVLERRS